MSNKVADSKGDSVSGASASIPTLVEIVALNDLSGERMPGFATIEEIVGDELIRRIEYHHTKIEVNDKGEEVRVPDLSPTFEPGCDFNIKNGEKAKIARKHAFAYYRDGNAQIISEKVRAEFDAEIAKEGN